MLSRLRKLSLALLFVAVSVGCQRKPPGPETDESLERALELVESKCAVQVEQGLVQCPGVEMGEVARGLLEGQEPRLAKLHTLARALSHPDGKRRVVAAHLVRNVYGASFGRSPKRGAVHPATADALLKAMVELPPPLATRVAPAAVHAAMLAGRNEALDAALRTLSHEEVRHEAHRALMIHGRLAAFPRIRDLTHGDFDQVTAALAGVGAMPEWTDAEQAEICPWVLGLTKHENPRVVAQAYDVLGVCQGAEYREILEKRSR